MRDRDPGPPSCVFGLVLGLGCGAAPSDADPHGAPPTTTATDSGATTTSRSDATAAAGATGADGEESTGVAESTSEDADPTTDESGESGESGDTSEPVPKGVPVFVAQGYLGRTAVSCDLGQTWTHEQALGDGQCSPVGTVDCAHATSAGRGIHAMGGWFFSGGGFGVRRAQDGVVWEDVLVGTSMGDIAAGNDTIVAAASGSPFISHDDGQTWRQGVAFGTVVPNIREAVFVDVLGGRFIMAASNIGSQIYDLVYSADNGDSWEKPTAAPDDACMNSIQIHGGIQGNDSVVVMVGYAGVACRSEDGGATWTTHPVHDKIESHLVWTGTDFMVWDTGRAFQSSDGDTWTSTPTVPPNIRLGPVSYGAGTFVAVTLGAYADQRFYNSADGITWVLSESFAASHPIREIAFARSDPTMACL